MLLFAVITALVTSAGSPVPWPTGMFTGHERVVATWHSPVREDGHSTAYDLLQSPTNLILRANYGFDQEVLIMPVNSIGKVVAAHEDDLQILLSCARHSTCVVTWSDVSGAPWFVARHDALLRLHFGTDAKLRDRVEHELDAALHPR